MKDLKQREIFRLAAVLYSESNYEVSPKTIHRKIIESVFIDNKNAPLNIDQIVAAIENNYGFIFSYEEVSDIIANQTEENFLIVPDTHSQNELMACLTSKRRLLLESRLNQNNVDFFIDEFLDLNSETFHALDGKSIIYKFLYEIFNNNISSFSKLIDYKKGLNGAINIDDSFNSVEKQLINTFLLWDNDLKNKAIFDISSYALEYCLITNSDSKATFHLKNLKNKIFYLDTNIVFRAIGINGESRSNKTTTFLNKFKDAGETLVISSFTTAEYKSTIRYYIEQIKKKNFSKVNPKTFKRFNKEPEFFDYYQRWRMNRNNDNLDYFESFLLSEYESFKKKFAIEEDYLFPFNDKNEEIIKIITELANDIYTFKNNEKLVPVRYETCISDAKNIYLIRERRNGNFRNIFETKYFFISSDQGLRRWDFKNNSSTPTVLLPSQWLSILLRYINRTSDDFKSFVSFLNLSQNETNISNEQLQLILVGISEITADFEKQSAIIEVMIDKNFKGILEKSLSDDEIIERSKAFAKSKLEADLDQVTEHYHVLSESLDAHIKGSGAVLYEMQIEKQQEIDRNKSIQLENRQLKQELRRKYVKDRFFWWQLVGYLAVVALILAFVFYLLIFICKDWKYNYAHKIINWIDTLPKDGMEHDIAKCIFDYVLPLSSISTLSIFINNRLINRTKRQKKLVSIEQTVPNQYL